MAKVKRLPKVSGEVYEEAWRHVERLEEENRRLRSALLERDELIARRAREKRIASAKARAKAPAPKRHEPAVVRAVQRMREAGNKMETIARELHLNWRTVKAILDGATPPAPERHRRPDPDPLKNCRLYLDTE